MNIDLLLPQSGLRELTIEEILRRKAVADERDAQLKRDGLVPNGAVLGDIGKFKGLGKEYGLVLAIDGEVLSYTGSGFYEPAKRIRADCLFYNRLDDSLYHSVGGDLYREGDLIWENVVENELITGIARHEGQLFLNRSFADTHCITDLDGVVRHVYEGAGIGLASMGGQLYWASHRHDSAGGEPAMFLRTNGNIVLTAPNVSAPIAGKDCVYFGTTTWRVSDVWNLTANKASSFVTRIDHLTDPPVCAIAEDGGQEILYAVTGPTSISASPVVAKNDGLLLHTDINLSGISSMVAAPMSLIDRLRW